MTEPLHNADNLDNVDARLLRLASLAVEESETLLALLPQALAVQWDRGTRGRGEPNDTGRRATGGHSDPTADTATDPARLHVRRVLRRAESALADGVKALRGVRRGLERAMDHWEGPQDETAT